MVGLSTALGSGMTVTAQQKNESLPLPAPSTAQKTPERILLTWTGDPAQTQTFTWRNGPGAPKVQIAPSSANPTFEKEVRTVEATCTEVNLPEGRKAIECKATITDLKPGTQYSYRVGNENGWSEWFHFKTVNPAADGFRFIYLGDVQNAIRSLCPRVVRAAYASAPDAHCIVHAGDLIEEGYDDALWGEWCYAMGWIGSSIPHLPVPGNHDKHRAPDTPHPEQVHEVSAWWRHRFSLPENGPEGVDCLRQEAYYLDYQGMRLIALDSNVYANEDYDPEKRADVAAKQTAWLEKVLADNPNQWTIVVHHHPLYSTGKDRDNVVLRETLLPLYDKYHVDLVLQGHDHHYGRTPKLVNSQIVAPDKAGTVYAVSVAGPKMYKRNPKFESLMTKILGDTQLYQIIEVKKDRLTYNAYSATGEQVDGFELKKTGKDSPSVLTNTTSA